MKFNFHKPNKGKSLSKATIHQTGKVGFSSEAEKAMKLSIGKSIKIGSNADDINDENLYAIVLNEKNEDAFSIMKAGKYFYLNTKNLLKDLKIDYLSEKIIFDIEEMEIEGTIIFKFNKRIINKKKDMPPI